MTPDLQPTFAFNASGSRKRICDVLGSRTGPLFCALPGLRVGKTVELASFLCEDGREWEMNGKVLRRAKLAEVHEILKQHPRSIPISKGPWFEIHVD